MTLGLACDGERSCVICRAVFAAPYVVHCCRRRGCAHPLAEHSDTLRCARCGARCDLDCSVGAVPDRYDLSWRYLPVQAHCDVRCDVASS